MTVKQFPRAAVLATCLAGTPWSAVAEPASFGTVQDATEAVVAALQPLDRDALLGIFGAEFEDVLFTGNDERDAQSAAAVVGLYGQGFRFRTMEDGAVELLLGADGWPFPVPLAKSEAGWAFDTETGREEVLARRIGSNELHVIDLMHVYVSVQAEYRLYDHDADGVMEFAASILPTDVGKRDGLFWDEPGSPLGQRVALASLDGYNDGERDVGGEPFGGYYFRLLTQQGAAAPGGAMDYMVGGNMVSGHALLAIPAEYGNSGIHSFMVAENGLILEADFGEETLETGLAITSYDPGPEWQLVE